MNTVTVAFCIYHQYLIFTILLFQSQLPIPLPPIQLNLYCLKKLLLSVIKENCLWKNSHCKVDIAATINTVVFYW